MIFLPHFLAFSKLKFSLLAKQKKTGRGSMESGDTGKIPIFEKLYVVSNFMVLK